MGMQVTVNKGNTTLKVNGFKLLKRRVDKATSQIFFGSFDFLSISLQQFFTITYQERQREWPDDALATSSRSNAEELVLIPLRLKSGTDKSDANS
jgi:hypothetical protein